MRWPTRSRWRVGRAGSWLRCEQPRGYLTFAGLVEELPDVVEVVGDTGGLERALDVPGKAVEPLLEVAVLLGDGGSEALYLLQELDQRVELAVGRRGGAVRDGLKLGALRGTEAVDLVDEEVGGKLPGRMLGGEPGWMRRAPAGWPPGQSFRPRRRRGRTSRSVRQGAGSFGSLGFLMR